MTEPALEYASRRYGTLKVYRLSDDMPLREMVAQLIREHYPKAIISLDDAERLVLIRDDVVKCVGYNCVDVSTMFPDVAHCACYVPTSRSIAYFARVEIDFTSKVNPAEQLEKDCRANSPAWVYQ